MMRSYGIGQRLWMMGVISFMVLCWTCAEEGEKSKCFDFEEKVQMEKLIVELEKEKEKQVDLTKKIVEDSGRSTLQYEDQIQQLKTSLTQFKDSKAQHESMLSDLNSVRTSLKNSEDLNKNLETKLRKQEEMVRNYEEKIANLKLMASASENSDVVGLKEKVAILEKENANLLKKLPNAGETMSLDAWLSTAFDTSVDMMLKASKTFKKNVEPLKQEGIKMWAVVKHQTSTLYDEYARIHVDPLVAQFNEVSSPMIKKYAPVVYQLLEKAEKQTDKIRSKLQEYRQNAVTFVRTKPGLAPYAQRIVDVFAIIVLAPFVVMLIPVIWSTVFGLIRFIVGIFCCCFCCGMCNRKKKPRVRRVIRKAAAPPAKKMSVGQKSKKNN